MPFTDTFTDTFLTKICFVQQLAGAAHDVRDVVISHHHAGVLACSRRAAGSIILVPRYFPGLGWHDEAQQCYLLRERDRGAFTSLADFYRRVAPGTEEMESLTKVGALDSFCQSRTAQFWELQPLHQRFGLTTGNGQGWLLPPPDTGRLPQVPLDEPSRQQRLLWEVELLGFPASGHPLELHSAIAWGTYCPVSQLGEHIGEGVTTCGLVIEQRVYNQSTGEAMKFITLADRSGIVETELFAASYRRYGLATVRYPVLEISAVVEPFENGRGFSLRVLSAGKPRSLTV